MSDSSPATQTPAKKAVWYSAYILRKGNKYRVSIVDVPASTEWTVVSEQTICAPGSTDLSTLKAEVDRLCQTPLSGRQAEGLVANLRGHVLGKTVDFGLEKYDTVGRRIRAAIVDDGIFALPIWLYYRVAFGSTPREGIAWIAIGVAPLVYRIVMHGWCGQTLGKMVTGVVVVDVSEDPLSWKQAILRELIHILGLIVFIIESPSRLWSGFPSHPPHPLPISPVSLLLGWSVLNIAYFLFDKKHRALHD